MGILNNSKRVKREIKFRAWEGGGFIYFELRPDHLIVPTMMPEKKDREWQQYTGLKDRTGQEIYEGDIVKWDHGVDKIGGITSPMVVAWMSGSNRLGWNLAQGERRRVIGNIYENPGLVKEATR